MKSSALAKTPMIGQVKLATRAEALEMDREAIAIVGEWESSFWRLGAIFMRIVDSKAYKALGFETEGAWLEARVRGSHSLSKAFAAMRCVRLLQGVPEQKLLQIGTVNAQTLTTLPESIRTSPEWIKKATEESTQEFRESRNKKMGIEPEEFRTWLRRFPKGVFDLGVEVEKEYATDLGLDIHAEPGKLIELWERLFVFLLQERPRITVELKDGD